MALFRSKNEASPEDLEPRLARGRSIRQRKGRHTARKLLTVVLILTIAAAQILATPMAAGAHHDRGDVRVEPARLYKYNDTHSWLRGKGGGTGSNGFNYVNAASDHSSRRHYAIWWMGNIRGEYRLRVFVPRTGAQPAATARVRYRVQELRDHGWTTVRSFVLTQSTSRGWRRFRTPIALNGPVRVLVRDYEAAGGTIAVDTVELQHYRYHSEDVETAVRACRESIGNLYDAGRWASSGLASLNPVTGAIAWASEGLLRDVIADNRDSLVGDCGRQLRYDKAIWLGPFPIRIGFFLSNGHKSNGGAKGVIYK